MAQRAFTLLKLLPHNPKNIARRAQAPVVVGFRTHPAYVRKSPSDIPLFHLGNRSLSRDSLASARSASPPQTPRSPTPPQSPATLRPTPTYVQLPANASWLHGQWKPGQVRAGIDFFERIANAQAPAAPTRPSSPMAEVKAKRKAPPPPRLETTPAVRNFGKSKRAPLPPGQTSVPKATPVPQQNASQKGVVKPAQAALTGTQTPLIAPSRVKNLAKTMLPVQRDPIAHAPVSVAPKPPAPPPLPNTPTLADASGGSAGHPLQRPHSEPGRSALFAELLNNPMVEKLRRQASSPATLATGKPIEMAEKAQGARASAAPSTKEGKASLVYLKAADIYPFHNQLEQKLGKRGEAEAHVPSPEALEQAEVLREKRAQEGQSHSYAGLWKPSEADHSVQQQLKMVLKKMGESST